MRFYLRIFNALLWLSVWIGVVWWTGTWKHWVPMFAEGMVPLMLGGYIHLILRRGGTRADV